MVGLLLSYKAGAFNVSYGFERHNDYFGLAQLGGSAGATATNTSSKDVGHELVAAYAFTTGTKVSAIVERLTYDTDDTVVGQGEPLRAGRLVPAGAAALGRPSAVRSLRNGRRGQRHGGGRRPGHDERAGWHAVERGLHLQPGEDGGSVRVGLRDEQRAVRQLRAVPARGQSVAPGASTTGFGLGILYTF